MNPVSINGNDKSVTEIVRRLVVGRVHALDSKGSYGRSDRRFLCFR